jgi:6-phosphogluconolactonase
MAGTGRISRLAVSGVVALACSLGLMGCGNFFSCEGKTSCPASGGGSTTGDYAYVSNSSLGSTYLNGYSLSSGTLVTATDFPFDLGYIPSAMAITPSNSYLYVASDSSTGEIYGYSIGTGGALTILDSGVAQASENVDSIDISPDGQWLLALDADGSTISEYSIASSTGLLKYATSYTYTGDTTGPVVAKQVKFAPSGDYFACALGTGGAVTFSFDTSTGVGKETDLISTGSAQVGFNAVDVDSNGYLYVSYVSDTGGLQVFSMSSAEVPTLLNTTPYPTGAGPNSLVVDTGNNYVYSGNYTDGSLSGFSIGAAGALTSLGSAYTGPPLVTTLGRDNSGSYIFAAGYSATSGFQVFQIGSTGALTVTNTAASGTDTTVPVVMALTH